MKTLAVIGTGIAGMSCAYFLRNRYALTVYEKNGYIGGHTNTIAVKQGESTVAMDTGFMVYNEHTYPKLIRFFEHLNIQAVDTSMSFSVNHAGLNFEASFSELRNFFPTLGSWLEVDRYRLLLGLKRLFKLAHAYLLDDSGADLSLRGFLAEHRIDKLTTERFLLPMTAAIWSTPSDRMLEYPAKTLLRFLANHGMLGFSSQFKWKTLKGGSQQYKDKILDQIGERTFADRPVASVRKENGKVIVTDAKGDRAMYDLAIVATHADQALALLDQPSPTEKRLLGSFAYNVNPVALHSDESVMPHARDAWSSWNYRYDRLDGCQRGSVHYWMNRLQSIDSERSYFVSVDYAGPLDESKVHWRYTYEHPRFSQQAIAAQEELPKLNQDGPLYFCGSYFRYGFHEDAFSAALAVVKRLSQDEDPLP